MYLTRAVNSSLSRYIDVSFFLRFVVLMAGIYYFNVGYISLIDDRGYIYSAYLDQHFNYFSLLRASILQMSHLITHSFGFNSYVADIYTLKIHHGRGVYIGLPCLGYGMMSFWLAFILAHSTSWKHKLWWSLGGVVFLWLLNCWRVALLLMAVSNHWNVNKWMDNHLLFNNVVYAIIIGMICLYYKVSKRETA